MICEKEDDDGAADVGAGADVCWFLERAVKYIINVLIMLKVHCRRDRGRGKLDEEVCVCGGGGVDQKFIFRCFQKHCPGVVFSQCLWERNPESWNRVRTCPDTRLLLQI